MPVEPLQSIVQYVQRIVDAGPAAASDAELLDRFARSRDESAFAILVWRHGPLVLGVCQRVLRHEQDSEDVFQATFLTLARKAGAISKKDALASWLYKVAFRIACRLRSKTPPLTNQAAALDARSTTDEIWSDLRGVLDDEIAGLPDRYRTPIVLCHFEGKTHEEAASLLGCPPGTLAARLSRGRDRLRQRLLKRGWTLSTGTLATVLAEKAASTAVSGELVRSTVQAALAYVSGTALSIKAAALAEGVLQMMWYSKVKTALIVMLALIVTTGGVGWAMHFALAGGEGGQVQKAKEPAGDAKADIAALKAEIAKLRSELKEVKSLLQSGKAGAVSADGEPTYAGKPLSVYLRNFKDRDPAFRKEAIPALTAFAEVDKRLIPILASALKDEGWYYTGMASDTRAVGDDARDALARLGQDVGPSMLNVLDDKAHPKARVRAAEVLAKPGIAPKSSAAKLLETLKEALAASEPDWTLRISLVKALGNIGPGAKSAAPIVAKLVLDLMNDAEARFKDTQQNLANFDSYSDGIAQSLLNVDPELRKIVPDRTWTIVFDRRDAGGDSNFRPKEVDAAWRQIRAALKKRYGQEKP